MSVDSILQSGTSAAALDDETADAGAPGPRPSDDIGDYRSLSATAVVSLLLAVVSVAALLDSWMLKALPVLGMVAGIVAWWRIRRLPTELSGRRIAAAGLALSTAFLVGGSALTLYTEATEVPEGAIRITYGQLKHPDDAKRDLPSPESRALEGKRVFIKGYMFATAQEKGITRFTLCRDNGDCCFGGRPPKSDMIAVELQGDLQTNFNGKLRHVAGVFHVADTESDDVKQTVIYRLEADYVK